MKSKFILIFLIFLFLLNNCKKEDGFEPAPDTTNEKVLITLVNEARSKGCNCGDEYFPPVDQLTWNDTLEVAALEHSKDMNKNNFFEHTGSDGSSAGDRITRNKYIWMAYGENIAKGYTSEQDVFKGWLNSPGHCKNIMSDKFKEMGVAKNGDYWTQDFASH